MTNTPDLSTISTYQKPVSPINGVGKILGGLALTLVKNTTDDHSTVIKFVQSLALFFGCRIEYPMRPINGHFTFFVLCPKDGCFNPEIPTSRKDCNCTSFKLSETLLRGHRYPGQIFYRLGNYSWNELRAMTNEVLPTLPLPLTELERLLKRFSPEAFSRTGTELNDLRLRARNVRELLEKATEALNFDGLC